MSDTLTIAITGANGFIGRHLVQRLARQGHQLHLLSRSQTSSTQYPNAQWFVGDLADESCDLSDFLQGVDLLFHCAGEITDPVKMRALHIEGTQRLVEAARGKVKRWVQLSSVGVYGPQRDGVVTENTPENPVGEYETTKAAGDAIVRKVAADSAMELVIVQPSNVFAAGMSNQSLHQLIKMIARGLYFYIGRPGAIANYIPVENVVEAMMLCGFHPQASGKKFIVSDSMPLEEMISVICSAQDVNKPWLRMPEKLVRPIAWLGNIIPGFPLTSARIDAMTIRARYDASLIAQELGYRNNVSLKDSMREFAAGRSAKS